MSNSYDNPAKPVIPRDFGPSSLSYSGGEQRSREDEDWDTWASRQEGGIISVLSYLPGEDEGGNEPPPASSFMITSHQPSFAIVDVIVLPVGANADFTRTYLSLLEADYTARMLWKEAQRNKDAFTSVGTVVVDGRMTSTSAINSNNSTYGTADCEMMRSILLPIVSRFATLVGAELRVEVDTLFSLDKERPDPAFVPETRAWKGYGFDIPAWKVGADLPESISHTYSLDLTELCSKQDFCSLVSGFEQFLSQQGQVIKKLSEHGKEANIILHLHTDTADQSATDFFHDAEFQRLHETYSPGFDGAQEIHLQLGGEGPVAELPYDVSAEEV